METIIRKVGNSAGLILPTQMIKTLNLAIGQQVNLEEADGRLIVTPKLRRRYTAAELNAQCDLSAPLPADLQGWEIAPAVGSEAL